MDTRVTCSWLRAYLGWRQDARRALRHILHVEDVPQPLVDEQGRLRDGGAVLHHVRQHVEEQGSPLCARLVQAVRTLHAFRLLCQS